MTSVTLNDGRIIPAVGLGVYKSEPGQETYTAVLTALQVGYRHVDTAAVYENEVDVGKAVRECGVPREQLWVTTKLWNSDHGYEQTLKACEESLKKLGLDYIDLYLVHAPMGGKRVETWKAMEELQRRGLARSIGVSNYGVGHLKELLASCNVKPAINQIELHPWLTRPDIVSFCEQNDIKLEAYSPLTKGTKLNDPTLAKIATSHGVSPAQVLIRWCVERGFIPLPKSVTKERMISNLDVFGFSLGKEVVDTLNALNCNLTTGWDPTTAP